jgi:hypothetical protein
MQIPLVQQLLVRNEHRKPGYLELGCQGSRGGQALASAQHALQNRAPKPLVDLPVKWRTRAAVDGHERKELRAGGGSHLGAALQRVI